MSSHDALREAIAAHAQLPALSCKAETVRYGELTSVYEHFDATLPDIHGARVAVLLVDSMACALLYAYLFERGALVIPLSPRAGGERLEYILDTAQPHYVFTNTALHKRNGDLLQPFRVLATDAPNTTRPVFQRHFEQTWQPGEPYNRDHHLRTLLFTSGSTGRPKGVCLSERNLCSAAGMMAHFLGLAPGRTTLATPPLFDYYGYIQFFAHALAGAHCVFGESTAFVGNFVNVLEQQQVTDLALVPHTLRQLLDLAETKSMPVFDGLKHLCSSSDMLPPELLARLFELNPDITVHNVYGLTEAGRAACRSITRNSPALPSIGHPSPGVDIAAQGDACEPGEIEIRGPNVAAYLQGIEDDAILLRDNAFIATGDLGYRADNGEIILVGRGDHMLNMMGEKLHPSVIEEIALAHPNIRDALAYTHTRDDKVRELVLEVVCDDIEEQRQGLESALKAGLPRAFIPTQIVAIKKVERTELGAKAKRS